jgi:hypothetical protein
MSSNASIASTAVLSVLTASAAAMLLLRANERTKTSRSKDSGSVGTAPTEALSACDSVDVEVSDGACSVHVWQPFKS